MLQYHKIMHRTCSTPKKKITRNVLNSERELRIERFMTAGFATRPLGEVGGVSRNRLLVDKMIVWRAILGLIMASKWPAPESQCACHFSNDRRHGRVTSADNAGSYAKNPASHFIMAMRTSATCNYAADLPRHYSGVVAKFNRKDWAVERGVTAAPSSDIRQA